jgi:hypothetical protein
MHALIYALVEASHRDEALAASKSAFDRLTGARPDCAPVFDYYVTFDDDGTIVAGRARWGELPIAVPITSDEGQQLLERGLQATEQEFQRNLDRIKEGLGEYSDEAIMRDEDLIRHACHQLGAYEGSPIFLYDEFGSGIRHRDRLDAILDGSDDLWIVPADVHF